MVPRTAHRIADDQSLRERALVVRAMRADGKQVASSAHQDRFVGIDTPKHAAAIGNLLDRKSIPEIWLCRFFRHESS
jgi:hypothetical protein